MRDDDRLPPDAPSLEGDAPEREAPDTRAILSRRSFLVRSALASAGLTGAVGVSAALSACDPRPNACLKVPAPEADATEESAEADATTHADDVDEDVTANADAPGDASEEAIAITITSDPPGAVVSRFDEDGQQLILGTTPLELLWRRGEGVEIWTLEHPSYGDAIVEVNLEDDGDYKIIFDFGRVCLMIAPDDW